MSAARSRAAPSAPSSRWPAATRFAAKHAST
jgi:hypothetical protein